MLTYKVEKLEERVKILAIALITSDTYVPEPEPEPEPEPLTAQSIKDEVISCLRGLGHKKKESTDVVNTLADRVEYKDWETLLKAILRGER